MQQSVKQIIQCPHCQGTFEIIVDTTAGDQSFVEDCQLCCHPVSVDLHIVHEHKLIQLFVKADNS